MPSSLCPSPLLTAFLALGLVSTGRAQATPPPAEPAASPLVDPAKAATAPAPDSSAAQPKHDRVMSDEVAATLASGMPKYNPPPKSPEPKPGDETTDLREIDKPKNRIIRLPKYTVTEPKPPVFRERDLHTKSELTDLALKKYYGLKIGNLGGLNNPRALLMYEEQERLNDMADLKDEAKTAQRSGDSAASEYITKESNRTYYRPSDFGWNSDGGGTGK